MSSSFCRVFWSVSTERADRMCEQVTVMVSFAVSKNQKGSILDVLLVYVIKPIEQLSEWDLPRNGWGLWGHSPRSKIVRWLLPAVASRAKAVCMRCEVGTCRRRCDASVADRVRKVSQVAGATIRTCVAPGQDSCMSPLG